VAFVLGQHGDAPVAAVDQVRQGEVDQPVVAAEWNGWFGPVGSQRGQAFTFTSGKDDGKDAVTRPCLPNGQTNPRTSS
jgi:hypothetical protein